MKKLLCVALSLISLSSFGIDRIICDHYDGSGKLLEDQRINMRLPESGMTGGYGYIGYINSDGDPRYVTTSVFYRSSMEPYTFCVHLHGEWNSDYGKSDDQRLCITPQANMDFTLKTVITNASVRCYDANLK